MARFILLDAGVVGLLCSSSGSPEAEACRSWYFRHLQDGLHLVLTDLSDFEVRRELLRIGATAKLRRLDDLRATSLTLPVNSESWMRAAEFWAFVRRAGRPTAGPDALDGDAILAAVAATIVGPGDEAIVATTNVAHLRLFPGVDARTWRQIT